MKDKLAKLIHECEVEALKANLHISPERIADYLIKEGVIVPPCKVGQTLYKFDDYVWKSDCEECEHFEAGWYDCPPECAKTRSNSKHFECIEIVEIIATKESIFSYMNLDWFGKKVFLTREEAEQALKAIAERGCKDA